MASDKRALIFYEEDVNRVLEVLKPYQAKTKTRANLLMDADAGHSLVQHGDPQIPLETVAAFVAASTAATRGIKDILTSDEFITVTHAGTRSSIQLTVVAEGTVLVTVFDQRTTVGAIVFYMKEVHAKLVAIVKDVATRKEKPVDLGAGFGDQASSALDDMFGENG